MARFEGIGQVADTLLAIGELLHDPEPRLVSQRMEEARRPLTIPCRGGLHSNQS